MTVQTVSKQLRAPAPPAPGVDRPVQRVFDVVGASILLGALAPLLAVLSLLILADSRGPIIYSQLRRGRAQRIFRLYKFRTMRPNAHGLRSRLFQINDVEDGILFKMKRDPRITRVGRFLRKWSLDELPQLLNVIKGDMSLVGPRPFSVEVFDRCPKSDRLYDIWVRDRHLVRPGMTGLWQVSGRNDLPFLELIRLDLAYVRRRGLFLDLSILFRTISVVVTGRGGY